MSGGIQAITGTVSQIAIDETSNNLVNFDKIDFFLLTGTGSGIPSMIFECLYACYSPPNVVKFINATANNATNNLACKACLTQKGMK